MSWLSDAAIAGLSGGVEDGGITVGDCAPDSGAACDGPALGNGSGAFGGGGGDFEMGGGAAFCSGGAFDGRGFQGLTALSTWFLDLGTEGNVPCFLLAGPSRSPHCSSCSAWRRSSRSP